MLHERYLNSTLTSYLFPEERNVGGHDTLPGEKESAAGAASSSTFQEQVNEPVPEDEKGYVAFPKANPVEESEVVNVAADLEELAEKELQHQLYIQTIMERWVECVECVVMLKDIDWLDKLPDTPENLECLNIIFKHGMKYCTDFQDGVLQPWKLQDWPLNPRVWLAEMERVLKKMAHKGWLPYWLQHPHDGNIREDASVSAGGSTDPGNYVLDVVVHALRLWQYSESSHISKVMKQSIAEYGERANKSAHGPVNLRGNIIEAMTRNLQFTGTFKGKGKGRIPEYDCVEYWWKWEEEYQSTWTSKKQSRTSYWGRGHASSSTSSWYG